MERGSRFDCGGHLLLLHLLICKASAFVVITNRIALSNNSDSRLLVYHIMIQKISISFDSFIKETANQFTIHS